MHYKSSSFKALKQFVRLIEKRIPLNVKIVAEIRLIWKDIVGDKMAQRSQVAKCEYIPKKDENGQETGEIKRRLLVHVTDGSTQTALTAYAADYLEKIPNRFKIHALRFQQSHHPFVDLEPSYIPQVPFINVSEEDREQINQQVQALSMSPEMTQSMIDYLIICKNLQHKNEQ
mgnify:FL=1